MNRKKTNEPNEKNKKHIWTQRHTLISREISQKYKNGHHKI